MSRKNRSPEEKARRAKIRELLQMANMDSMDDIQNLFKETIAEFMERRYVVVKATAGFAVCRLILKLLLFYSCLDFTQNLGKPPVCLSGLRCKLMSVP